MTADYPSVAVGYLANMVTRIGPKTPIRHYLFEWREKVGLTQEQVAERLPLNDKGKATGKDQISRWETGKRGMTMAVQAALAEALGLDNPGDLFRDPAQPSADELLRNASPELKRAAIAVVEAMVKTGTEN